MTNNDARTARFVEVHCPKCHQAFAAPKFETSAIKCCGREYLVVVLYGHIFVEHLEPMFSESEFRQIKEWRDNQ